MKKGLQKIVQKKGATPCANKFLFQCQEAPGEAASRAHCSDKKQLFEQQLKHCSRFLQKKSEVGSKLVQKTDWIAESSPKTEWIAENCGLLKTKAKVQTIVETNGW